MRQTKKYYKVHIHKGSVKKKRKNKLLQIHQRKVIKNVEKPDLSLVVLKLKLLRESMKCLYIQEVTFNANSQRVIITLFFLKIYIHLKFNYLKLKLKLLIYSLLRLLFFSGQFVVTKHPSAVLLEFLQQDHLLILNTPG